MKTEVLIKKIFGPKPTVIKEEELYEINSFIWAKFNISVLNMNGFEKVLLCESEVLVYLKCHFINNGDSYIATVTYKNGLRKYVNVKLEKLLKKGTEPLWIEDFPEYREKLQVAFEYFIKESNYRLELLTEDVEIYGPFE
jgi:hypothetical protein